jgi:hypothetical protein
MTRRKNKHLFCLIRFAFKAKNNQTILTFQIESEFESKITNNHSYFKQMN